MISGVPIAVAPSQVNMLLPRTVIVNAVTVAIVVVAFVVKVVVYSLSRVSLAGEWFPKILLAR